MKYLVKGSGDVVAFWPARGERMIEVLAATSDSPRSVWINPRSTRKSPDFYSALEEAQGLCVMREVVQKLHLK